MRSMEREDLKKFHVVLISVQVFFFSHTTHPRTPLYQVNADSGICWCEGVEVPKARIPDYT